MRLTSQNVDSRTAFHITNSLPEKFARTTWSIFSHARSEVTNTFFAIRFALLWLAFEFPQLTRTITWSCMNIYIISKTSEGIEALWTLWSAYVLKNCFNTWNEVLIFIKCKMNSFMKCRYMGHQQPNFSFRHSKRCWASLKSVVTTSLLIVAAFQQSSNFISLLISLIVNF